jgi:hypothetical protein
MVSFVHIADKKDEASIAKNGISAAKRRTGVQGVYAVPVMTDFASTHLMGWRIEEARRQDAHLRAIQDSER